MRSVTRPTALSVIVFFGLSCATTHDKNWTGDDDETGAPAKKQATSASSSSAAPPQSFVAAPSGDDSDFTEEAPAPATPGAAESHSAFDSESSSHKAPTEPIPESNPPPSTGGVPIIVDNSGSPPPDQAFIGEQPSKKHKKKHKKKQAPEVVENNGVVIRDVPPSETVMTPEQPAPEVTRNDNSDDLSSPAPARHESHTTPAPEELSDNTPPPAPRPPPPPDPTLQRDKKWIGISITAGAGVFLSSNFRGIYTPKLAYGGQITIDPKFAGNFALDVGFWRASQYGGTTFDSITGSTSEISARILYLQRIGAGFFIGGGLGFDLTWSAAQFAIDGAGTSASQFQPGGEATFALGWRISYFETRLDVRAILSGGLRMDYLPDLSVGVTF